MSMYAKLFSRITESSLMEEPINVRYTFVMLLAVADPKGYAIGTDVALARRLNMPINEFRQCVEILMKPDPDSNSKEEEGRRVIESDGERGYKVVNYMTYREMKDQEERREYMQRYMRSYREKKASLTGGKQRKQKGASLTQAEEEAEVEAKAETKAKADKSGYSVPACFESVDGFSAALAGWIEARKAKRNPATGRAIQILINRLQERPADAIAALDLATERGWATMNWEWFDKAKPSTGQRNGEYQEQIDIEKFTFRA